MKYIFRFGMLSLALGLIVTSAEVTNGQNRRIKAKREYRQDVREARRDYRQDLRSGDNRYKARRGYNRDIREARRDYIRNVTRGRSGWTYYQNNRRYYRPYAQYTYRNGRFFRRW